MIGFFDSGFGGLTVLKAVLQEMPEYDYIYLGDNARAPYGGRSQEVIYQYTREAVDFLFSHGASLIVIACNTASSMALRRIQQEYLPAKYPGKNVLGVIRPLAENIVRDKKLKRVGVIGTRATIESDVYPIEIHKLNQEMEVLQNAAPILVPLIEEGWSKKAETRMILRKYLRPLKEQKVQSLILGCTHYPLLLKEMQNIMGARCRVCNPGDVVAKSLREYLTRHPEYNLQKNSKIRKFYITDSVERFKLLGEKFLGEKMVLVEKISL
ncbi:glutamate racemase [Candidatus Parcubacteria bacterium]|nr:glutamate racemase [Patescibacteria group bacterium]MBU4309654.1 glutamate racemase [Patescibacteria group bacterium]MBU4432038.1 glutamate racemase [Patescibacteria group bacterium]MBU4577958.1 glutamate racemase [Patescibacteria group bacterium]MCG2696533.1 glutamate racemase [Candidatus Parcubacteria bacterium]